MYMYMYICRKLVCGAFIHYMYMSLNELCVIMHGHTSYT